MNFPQVITKYDFQKIYQSEIWSEAAREICARHKIPFQNLNRAGGTEHVVFFVDDRFVIKVFAPFRRGFEREKAALEFASGKTSLKTPEIVAHGEFEQFNYLVTTQLSGGLMTRVAWLELTENEQTKVVEQLAAGLKELHSHPAETLDFDWREFIKRQTAIAVERQIDAGVNPEWIEKLPAFLESSLPLLPKNFEPVFLHGDVHFGNLLLQKTNGEWQISGLFDFADSLCGFHEYDFLAVGVLMIQGQREIQRRFFRAYGYAENELDEDFRRRLMLMTVLYECSDLRRYAIRLKPEAVNFSFDELKNAIWSFAN